MSNDKFAGECEGVAEDLADSLTDHQVKRLHKLLSQANRAGWAVWRQENREMIARFVAATPSQRNKRVGWNKPAETKLYLCLAGYQHCMEGAKILKASEKLSFRPRSSYRDIAQQAGSVYQKLLDEPAEEWPYYHSYPNPFQEDEF